MAIVGFGFTKMAAERKGLVKGKVNINNNVMVAGVEDAAIPMAPGKKSIRVRFSFDSRYEPELGSIRFEGEVLLLEDTKVAEEVLARWSKEHALPSEMFSSILNHILDHSNVEALIVARDLNLPPPIPLPKANLQPPPAKSAPPAAAEQPKEQKVKKK
jgi:hypothetical protein